MIRPLPREFFYRGSGTPSPIAFQEWFSRYSRTGKVGDPTKASREKGLKVRPGIVSRLGDLITEFRDREIRPRVDHH